MGSITELVGEPSTGKSYLALRTIAAAQQQGKTCLLIDSECSYDARWAQRIGVEISGIMVAQPTVFEQAEAIITEALGNRLCDLLVIDSLDALVPRLSGTSLSTPQSPYEVSHILNRFIPQLRTLTEIADAACLITSQYRQRGDEYYSLANGLMREHASVRALLSADSEDSTLFKFELKRHNFSHHLGAAFYHIDLQHD